MRNSVPSSPSCRLWLTVIRQGGVTLILAVILGLSVNQLRPGKPALVADWYTVNG